MSQMNEHHWNCSPPRAAWKLFLRELTYKFPLIVSESAPNLVTVHHWRNHRKTLGVGHICFCFRREPMLQWDYWLAIGKKDLQNLENALLANISSINYCWSSGKNSTGVQWRLNHSEKKDKWISLLRTGRRSFHQVNRITNFPDIITRACNKLIVRS